MNKPISILDKDYLQWVKELCMRYRQSQIKAAVNVPGNARIRSGYSANAKIVLESADSVLAVPESTLEFSGDSVFVYVMGSDSTYARRQIVTGLSDGINIEVREGVAADDKLRGNRIYKSK